MSDAPEPSLPIGRMGVRPPKFDAETFAVANVRSGGASRATTTLTLADVPVQTGVVFFHWLKQRFAKSAPAPTRGDDWCGGPGQRASDYEKLNEEALRSAERDRVAAERTRELEAESERDAMAAVGALERAFVERFAPNGLGAEGSELWWSTPFAPTRREVIECIGAFALLAERIAHDSPLSLTNCLAATSLVRLHLAQSADRFEPTAESERVRALLSSAIDRLRARYGQFAERLLVGDSVASVTALIDALAGVPRG